MALVASITRLTQFLLGLAGVVNIAVVFSETLFVNVARLSARGAVGITDIGFARFRPAVAANTTAIAGVIPVDGAVGTVLVQADGAVHPEATGTRTVAETVLITTGLSCAFTVIGRVFAIGDVATGVAGTSADLAHGAVIFGVCIEGVEGAGPQATGDVARFAAVFAGIVAAVSVDAEVGETLVGCATGLAVVLLGYARVAQAVEGPLAIDIAVAVLEAVGASAVADIRDALLRGRIDTGARPVTEVIRIARAAHTGLGHTNGRGIPVLATTRTVADAVVATLGLIGGQTVFLRVDAGLGIAAGARPVADLAQAALELGVRGAGVVDAHTGTTTDKLGSRQREGGPANTVGRGPRAPYPGLRIIVGPDIDGEPDIGIQRAQIGTRNGDFRGLVVGPAGVVRPETAHRLRSIPAAVAVMRDIGDVVGPREGNGIFGLVIAGEDAAAKQGAGAISGIRSEVLIQGDEDLVRAQIHAADSHIEIGRVPGHVVRHSTGTGTQLVGLDIPVGQRTVDDRSRRGGPGAGAGLARRVTPAIAAVPVNAGARNTLAIDGAGVAIGFLVGTLIIVIAPVPRNAVGVFEAQRTALVGIVAHVWRTILLARIGTRTVAAAEVSGIENVTGAALGITLRLVAPESAGIGTITLTIEATVAFGSGLTFRLGVGSSSRWLTLARAITDAAQTAFVLWVGVVGEVHAGTDRATLITTRAGPVAGVVATDTVDAEAGLALVADKARIPIVVLLFALVVSHIKGIAPVGRDAVVVLGTHGPAIQFVGVAHIGRAVDRSTVMTLAIAIAKVGGVLRVLDARLRRANRVRRIERTATGTVADTVVTAGCGPAVEAVILRVQAGIGIDAGPRRVTHLARGAIAIGVVAGGHGVTFTRVNAISGSAGIAGFLAKRIAAETVHAEAGGTFDVLVARVTGVFGRDALVVGIAEVPGDAVNVLGAAVAAFQPSVIADVGVTCRFAAILTNTGAIAGIRQEEGGSLATLGHTDGTGCPETAGPRTITEPAVATGRLVRHRTFALGVSIHGCRGARAVSRTHLAEAAIAFGVGLFRVPGTEALGARKATGLAVGGTIVFAADTVDAEVRFTLIPSGRTGAGFAQVFLNDALGAVAPGIRGALGIGDAVGVASQFRIADVRIAHGQALIDAQALAVTNHGSVFVVGHAPVGNNTVAVGAHRTLQPVPAGANTVAGPIQATTIDGSGNALILGVGAGNGRCTRPGTVTHRALAAIPFGVALRCVVGASPFQASDVAGRTRAFTRCVTTHTVHAVVGQALAGAGAGGRRFTRRQPSNLLARKCTGVEACLFNVGIDETNGPWPGMTHTEVNLGIAGSKAGQRPLRVVTNLGTVAAQSDCRCAVATGRHGHLNHLARTGLGIAGNGILGTHVPIRPVVPAVRPGFTKHNGVERRTTN